MVINLNFYSVRTSEHDKWVYSSRDLSSMQPKECVCGRLIYDDLLVCTQTVSFVVEEDGQYPDFLLCGGTGLSVFAFVVSERVLDAFQNEGISGYTSIPIRIVREINSETKSIFGSPRFALLNISGRIDLDYEKMHIKKKHLCKECGQFNLSRQKIGTSYIDEASWNGQDVCRLNTFPAMIICTQKVIDTIRKYRLLGSYILDEKHIFMPQYAQELIF